MRTRTWAEVDLDAIYHNYSEFKRVVNGQLVMCILKANAYGHGAVAIGKYLQSAGADFFGVASLDEAIELCKNGITVPTLVLSYTAPERLAEVEKYENIRLTVFDCDTANEISKRATTTIKIHIKVDTGMNRIGFQTEKAFEGIKHINELQNIEIEGLFTHFSSADETSQEFTIKQFKKYTKVSDQVREAGIDIKIRHVCNSSAALMCPEMQLDMSRLGIILYGSYPSDEIDTSLVTIRPAMQLKTQIININHVPAGVDISYNRMFTTKRDSVIATIPIGYADGLLRGMRDHINVLVAGQLVPVVGRICMDQCMIDITDIKDKVKLLDEVVIFGEQDGEVVLVEEIGELVNTNSYEILCNIRMRVPRIYLSKGKVVDETNYLT